MTPKQLSYPSREEKYPLNVDYGGEFPEIRLGETYLGLASQGPLRMKAKTCFLEIMSTIPSGFNYAGHRGRYNWKQLYKDSIPLVGASIVKRVKGASWNTYYYAWPEEVRNFFHSPLRTYKPILSNDTIRRAFKYEGLLSEQYHDGLIHLAPLAALQGLTIAEAKKLYGKGLWKRLTKASPYKLRLLGAYLERDGKTEFIEPLLELRSGILKEIVRSSFPNVSYSIRAGQLAPRVEDFWSTNNLLVDTVRMSLRFDTKVNPKWGLSRIKEEHEYLTLLMRDAQRKEALERNSRLSVAFVQNPIVEEIDGFTFTQLTKGIDIVDEGAKMQHCVGSYADRAFNREYEVFTVEGSDERATLGLYLSRYEDDTPYRFSQCYRERNGRVSDTLQAACNKLIRKLNERKDTYDFRLGIGRAV